jgi:hypothetical protein
LDLAKKLAFMRLVPWRSVDKKQVRGQFRFDQINPP